MSLHSSLLNSLGNLSSERAAVSLVRSLLLLRNIVINGIDKWILWWDTTANLRRKLEVDQLRCVLDLGQLFFGQSIALLLHPLELPHRIRPVLFALGGADERWHLQALLGMR